jgi:YesN/AraC family two-component response regulator
MWVMFRLFIVDDNKYERNGIRDSIDWQALGIEVVGVFANGLDALASMDELQPHIVVTDIAMPMMNGVEMAERIRRSYPEVKMVFISCHSDFEFAKSAVDLGVYSYVLKPIIDDELEKALRKLLLEFTAQHRQQVEKERMLKQLEGMLPLVQEQFLKEVLLGNFRNKEEIMKRIEFLTLPIIESVDMSVISIKCNSEGAGKGGRSVVDSYLFSYSIKRIVSESESKGRTMYPVQMFEDDFAVIVFDTGSGRQGILEVAVELHTEIGRRLDLHATMGISKSSTELTELAQLLKQSRKAVNTRFYSGSNPIILFEEIEDRTDIPFEEMPGLESVYQDMKALISEGGVQEVGLFIDKYLNVDGLGDSETYVKGFVSLFVHMTGIILMETNNSAKEMFGDSIMVWDKLNRMKTKEDIVQWTHQTLLTIIERLSDKSGAKNVKLVDSIKSIIHARYSEQLSIEDISKSVFLSGRHANGLFKKATGKTIFDYLIQYRIERAKQLLREEDGKVAVVAEAVGYLNTSYFILSFKKNVGMTPAEYKNKLTQR